MSNARNLANLLGTNTTIQTANLADDAITAAKLASSLNLSSKTLTMPTAHTVNGLQYIQTTTPGSSASSFDFAVDEYSQYMVFMSNVGSSTQGANLLLKASNDDGSTYESNMNRLYFDMFVSDTTNIVGTNSGNQSSIILADNLWNNAAAGSNGYFIIGGTAKTGHNTRLTVFGMIGKQSPSNQEVEIIFGQTQDDSNQYDRVRIQLSGGNFQADSQFTIFGIKHH